MRHSKTLKMFDCPKSVIGYYRKYQLLVYFTTSFKCAFLLKQHLNELVEKHILILIKLLYASVQLHVLCTMQVICASLSLKLAVFSDDVYIMPL